MKLLRGYLKVRMPTVGNPEAVWPGLATLAAATCLVASAGLVQAAPSDAAAQRPRFAEGRILVAPSAGSDEAAFNGALAAHGARSRGRIGSLSVHSVDVPPGAEERVVEALSRNPHVRFAEVDGIISPAMTVDDPSFGSEWHLPKINAPVAWDSSIGTGVTIAILDSGVDGAHPDLAPQMVPGWNFLDNNDNTADVNGHGTVVAGAAAAASNNGIGVASVAGGARIMPVRIADASAYAYWSTTAKGINWAADRGARVANLSYVGASSSSTIITAAQYLRSKGGVLLVAAGNTGAVDNTAPTPYITVVAATDSADARASYSTYGSFVDIAAPGSNIMTTKRGGSYGGASGTSLATPVVAGVAALVLAKRPDFSPAQVDSLLTSTAKDLGTAGADIYFGAGRVDAAAAIASATAAAAVDTTPPTAAIASPTGGSVAGTVAVAVSASDNMGVARVELRANGTAIATDSASPYQFAWDSTGSANSSVTLTAVAFDAAGNSATSAPVTVNVSNTSTGDTTAPTVSIASPTGGTVTGTVTVSINASDNIGVTRVDLRVNGATVGSTNVSPYKLAWNSTSVANGTATLSATAYDAAGNSRTSSNVSVNVSNTTPTAAADTTPPVLSITNPTNGATVSGKVNITTSASDNSGASGIRQSLYINGTLIATVTGATMKYGWNTSKIARGTYAIKVIASDQAGNSSTAQVTVTR
jgi:subtilisin family serine protease